MMFSEELNKIFEESYSTLSDNPCIDILLNQIKNCLESIDSMLEHMEGDYEEKAIELWNIFQYQNGNTLKQELSNKAFESFRVRVDFELSEDFIVGLALIFSNLQLFRSTVLEHGEKIINDRCEKHSIFHSLKYLTDMAISIGELKYTFISQAKNYYRDDVEPNFHTKGGLARKEKYEQKKQEALKIFENGNFRSYAECARAIHQNLEIKDPNTIAKWLSNGRKKQV